MLNINLIAFKRLTLVYPAYVDLTTFSDVQPSVIENFHSAVDSMLPLSPSSHLFPFFRQSQLLHFFGFTFVRIRTISTDWFQNRRCLCVCGRTIPLP